LFKYINGFSRISVFESLRFGAFGVSCVPVQSDAYKSITSQSLPGRHKPSLPAKHTQNARPAQHCTGQGHRGVSPANEDFLFSRGDPSPPWCRGQGKIHDSHSRMIPASKKLTAKP
jgi:hypothetical protein